jgi:hypothetical protein
VFALHAGSTSPDCSQRMPGDAYGPISNGTLLLIRFVAKRFGGDTITAFYFEAK